MAPHKAQVNGRECYFWYRLRGGVEKEWNPISSTDTAKTMLFYSQPMVTPTTRPSEITGWADDSDIKGVYRLRRTNDEAEWAGEGHETLSSLANVTLEVKGTAQNDPSTDTLFSGSLNLSETISFAGDGDVSFSAFVVKMEESPADAWYFSLTASNKEGGNLGRFSINFTDIPMASLPETGKTESGLFCWNFAVKPDVESVGVIAYMREYDYKPSQVIAVKANSGRTLNVVLKNAEWYHLITVWDEHGVEVTGATVSVMDAGMSDWLPITYSPSGITSRVDTYDYAPANDKWSVGGYRYTSIYGQVKVKVEGDMLREVLTGNSSSEFHNGGYVPTATTISPTLILRDEKVYYIKVTDKDGNLIPDIVVGNAHIFFSPDGTIAYHGKMTGDEYSDNKGWVKMTWTELLEAIGIKRTPPNENEGP
jgi:hypothetical protein